MAQITIVIDSNDASAHDLQILRAIGGFSMPGVNEARGATIDESGDIHAPSPEPEPVPQAEAPKRGRPKKTAEPEKVPSSGTQVQTDAGGPSELEAALLDEGEAETQVTAQDVMQAMHKHIEKHGAPATLPLLQQHGNGAASFKQLTPDTYPAVYAALTAGL